MLEFIYDAFLWRDYQSPDDNMYLLIKLNKVSQKGEILNYVLSASYTIQQNCVYVVSAPYICISARDPHWSTLSLYSVCIKKNPLIL